MESWHPVVGHVAGKEFPEMWRSADSWCTVDWSHCSKSWGGFLSSSLKQAKYAWVMCCFIFRCSSGGGREAVGWNISLANGFKSSRVRCVSKCVFFYRLLLEFGNQVVFVVVTYRCSLWILPPTWTPCPQAVMVSYCGLCEMSVIVVLALRGMVQKEVLNSLYL